MSLYKQPKSPMWWGRYRDANGVIRRRSTGCRGKDAAASVLTRWKVEVERIKAGIVSPAEAEAAKHAARPMSEHLADFESILRAKGTARHAAETVGYCRRVCDDLGARSPNDLRTADVDRWFAARRAEGMGACLANHHLRAMKGLGNWMKRTGRLNGDGPAAALSLFDEDAERRHIRRALREEEVPALVRTAALRPLAERGRERIKVAGNKRSNWTYAPLTPDNLSEAADRARAKLLPLVVLRLEAEGKAHAMFYRGALGSGFRAGELSALRVADFDSNAGTFALDAGAEKARRGVEGQPLPPELVADLAAWVAARGARLGDRLFPKRVTVKAFDRDLAAAGIAKHDDRGRVLDIHALRGTFISWLQKAGASLKEAQHLARHSDPKVTGRYTDLTLLNFAGRVAALPSTRPAPAETDVSRPATGTTPA